MSRMGKRERKQREARFERTMTPKGKAQKPKKGREQSTRR